MTKNHFFYFLFVPHLQIEIVVFRYIVIGYIYERIFVVIVVILQIVKC